MAEYIDKQAFLEGQRHLYCENCAKRKGMKQRKMQFVYEIGDAPCRSCGYGDVLDNLEDFPAADVRPVVLCKDCKHYQIDQIEVGRMVCVKDADEADGYFSGFLSYPSEDWFCADGEKREES